MIGYLYKTHQDHWNSSIQKNALEHMEKFETIDAITYENILFEYTEKEKKKLRKKDYDNSWDEIQKRIAKNKVDIVNVVERTNIDTQESKV